MKTNLQTASLAGVFGLVLLGGDNTFKPSSGIFPGIKPPGPNIILIMTDDQGYGDIAYHGNPVVQTPNIDRLASESISFTNFHVDPYCAPTRAALMTGRYSHRTGVWGTVAGRNMLRDGEITMAEMFRNNGYQTGLFGKWHLGSNYPYRPIDRGFNEWLGKGDGGTGCVTDYWGNDRVNDIFIHNGKNISLPGYETDVLFDEAINFIGKNKHQPFFVLLTPYAVHSPESIPDLKWLSPYAEKVSSTVADFYATISNIDDNVGKIREFLRREELEDNTILIFMTDNGSAENPFPAGMKGKKGSVYEGGHKVPCFFYWPKGCGRKPREIDHLTAHLDLLPTFVDLCSLKMSEPIDFDGVSLRPLLKNSAKSFPDRTLVIGTIFNFTQLPRAKWEKTAVMHDNWRLVNGTELYDLTADPGQEKDLADSRPEIVYCLKADYEEYWNDVTFETRDWVNSLGRPILGGAVQQELFLCSEDWISDDCPWNQYSVAIGARNFGFWRIRVEKPGIYRVEARRWPREANAPLSGLPSLVKGSPDAWIRGKPVTNILYRSYAKQPEEMKALPVEQVKLKIAGYEKIKTVGKDDTEVVFEVELPAGEASIEARLIDAGGNDLAGAYFLYLRPAN